MRTKALSLIVLLACASTALSDDFADAFKSPTDDTKPWCYWYWLNGRVSAEGITRDLEGMARAGISEALIGHVSALPEGDGDLKLLSEEWWQLVDHAVREAQRVGVDIGMFNGPGWSQSGGPWVPPEEAMQYVASSEVRVQGPVSFSGTLAIPKEPFTDIAVIAYPAPLGDTDFVENHAPAITISPAGQGLEKMIDAGTGSITAADSASSSQPDLSKAHWIWYPKGNPLESAPGGACYFRYTFTLPEDASVREGTFSITADNAQQVWLNGRQLNACTGDNFKVLKSCRITEHLKPGLNIIAVRAENAEAGPAGLLAAGAVSLANGDTIAFHSNRNWKAQIKPRGGWRRPHYRDARWEKAKELAPYGAAPWGTLQSNTAMAGVIDWELEEPFTARSLTFHFTASPIQATGKLQAAEPDGSFRTVKTFSIDRAIRKDIYGDSTMFMPTAPLVVAFAPTSSKHFRLVLDGTKSVEAIKLSSGARVADYVEKRLGRLWPTPLPNWDSYMWPRPDAPNDTTTAVPLATIQQLSDKMAADGTLTWDVPEGEWIIQRLGMTPTGIMNRPTAKEATGLECDKMSKAAIENHFNAMIGKVIERVPDDQRTALKHVIIDSYEVGGQDWTPGFEKVFEKRLGYDPLPWLPVLSGRVVGSPDQSERFLWDLRRLVADLIGENYVGGLSEVSNQHGLKLWLENYGHWGYPGEFLQYGGEADHVSGEFWATGDLGSIELRDAASCAHIYGKGVVSAEAFTNGLKVSDHPFNLKRRGDWAYTNGINHFVLHVYAHQPVDAAPPGMNPWFGTAFHRNNPWFHQMRSWVSYLQRCHYMLQQGQHVADVAYFIGEDAPKMSGVRQQALPAGYNYDDINAEVILERVTVKDGHWTLPDGMRYRVLALPAQETMTPELLTRIRDLVKQGGVLLGVPPERSPSLKGYPVCDNTVQQLAAEIWGDCDGKTVQQRAFGKGLVFNGMALQAVLDTLQVTPEITIEHDNILWTHRATPDADIYFITNQATKAVTAPMSFRVTGKVPEVWDPASGEIVQTAWFQHADGRTRLTVCLDGSESAFVVFREPFTGTSVDKVLLKDEALTPSQVTMAQNDGALEACVSDAGKYTVQFNNGQTASFKVDAVPKPITLDDEWEVSYALADGALSETVDTLTTWTKHADEQVKTFCGTATYHTSFTLPADALDEAHRLTLNLGRVGIMAEVLVNGETFDTLWKPPFDVDITGVAKAGENALEVRVTNAYKDKDSGLLGPVTVNARVVVPVRR